MTMKIIKFSAEWCRPCQTLAPIFEKAKQYYTSIDFIECDIEENPELAEKYHIRNIPTLILLDGENEVLRKSGTITYQGICSIIDSTFIEKKVA